MMVGFLLTSRAHFGEIDDSFSAAAIIFLGTAPLLMNQFDD